MGMFKVKRKLTNRRLTINLRCLRSYKAQVDKEWEITLPQLIKTGIKRQIWIKRALASSHNLHKTLSKMCLIANF